VIGTQKWGIGNSNPQNKLDISATTWDDGILIKNTGNFNTGIIADANRSGAGGGLLNLQARWNGTEVAGILFNAGSDTTNKDDGVITFRTASAGTPAERMRIDSSGRAMIGTTTADGILKVSDTDNETYLVVRNDKSGGSGEAVLSLKNDVGNWQVKCFTDDTFKIRDNTNGADRLTINTSGHVIAPNLNTTGSTNNRYPLYWVHTGTTGSIEPYTGSIRAMKTDINDMGSVDWIHSLTPRSFKFRDYETDEDGNRTYLETTNDLPNTEYGLIAEEVNQVNGSDYILDKQIDEDGTENLKGVLYHNLVPVLLKAVQEQKNTIQELEARITTLEANNP